MEIQQIAMENALGGKEGRGLAAIRAAIWLIALRPSTGVPYPVRILVLAIIS